MIHTHGPNAPEKIFELGGVYCIYQILHRANSLLNEISFVRLYLQLSFHTKSVGILPATGCRTLQVVLSCGPGIHASLRFKKPRCWEMSARGYALHSVCLQLSFFLALAEPCMAGANQTLFSNDLFSSLDLYGDIFRPQLYVFYQFQYEDVVCHGW